MKINFGTKLTIGFDLILILISTLIINFFYSKAHYVQRDNLRSRLIGIASTAALMIDGDKHDLLRRPADANSAVFGELKHTLTRIKEANPGITYIYTMRRTDDPNTFQFVIDEAEELDTNGNGVIDEDEETAAIGDPYDVSTYPELRAAYGGPRADRVLQSDQWGTWLSGYAPIFNSKMEPVGIIGIDMSAQHVKAEEGILTYTAIILFLLAAAGSIVAGSLLARHFTKPIKELLEGIHKVTRGDLKTRLEIQRRDEIGELGRAFNKMAESLGISRRELDEYNRLLEVKVSERTRELKEAQDAILQTKKMAAVGTLAAGVAHEFNNIFACIRGSAELALENDDPPARKEALKLALKMSDRARVITTALQAYSPQEETLKKEKVSLNDVLELSLSLFKSNLTRLNITVVKDFSPLPEIWGDREQLQHALGNILANARDAMTGTGGILTVSTGVRNGSVFARISDTGPGIDPANRDVIFEPFHGDKGLLAKGKKGYAGLGLFIASGIIRNLGGEIQIESDPGAGAAFTVLIPCPEAAPEVSAPEAGRLPEDPPRVKKILCVDDEEFIAENLQRFLCNRGFEADVAFNGHEAVEKVRGTAYGLILMDIAMPDMDGETTIKKILELRPETRFLIISGYSPHSLSKSVLGSVIAFLQKPFALPQVEIEIRRVFGGKGTAPV